MTDLPIATEKISIRDAVTKGITKLRLPHWACPDDHVEIHIDRTGNLGPWVKLWSPLNEIISGHNPLEFLTITFSKDELDETCWIQYKEKTDVV